MDAPFIGTIFPFAGNFAPMYYANCWGQSYTVNQYQALYAILGNIYGGNTTAFLLPELRGRALVGYGASPTLGNWVEGKALGSLSTALTANNLPIHTHGATFTGTGITGAGGATTTPVAFTANVTVPVTSGGTPVSAPASGNVYLGGVTFDDNLTGASLTGPYNTTAAATGAAQVQGTATGTVNVPTGGGGIPTGTVAVQPGGGVASPVAISVLQPVLAINFIIAIQGLFPTRD